MLEGGKKKRETKRKKGQYVVKSPPQVKQKPHCMSGIRMGLIILWQLLFFLQVPVQTQLKSESNLFTLSLWVLFGVN